MVGVNGCRVGVDLLQAGRATVPIERGRVETKCDDQKALDLGSSAFKFNLSRAASNARRDRRAGAARLLVYCLIFQTGASGVARVFL